ncbi:histamine H2 receptor-like isoform X1 [Callorhinchus milii]|uniref:histamine H2 receptor-like isoform X1 n=1 Tax=Callorhinchus milii TaxID=7868 RepID=UPI001C3FBF68|nr:histamine H2 receptor-like isoform X1 [Callorhinchus milii]
MSSLDVALPGLTASDNNHQYSTAETAIQTFLYLLILIIGLPLNVTVLVLLYKCRSLRNVTNMFVFSLAMADFLIALLGLPFIIMAIVAQSWPLGGTFCQIAGFVTLSLQNISILSVAGVALDRYYVIAKPFILTITREKAKKMIVFVWWNGVIYGIPPLFGIGLFKFSPTRCLCEYSWSDGGSSLVYGIYIFIWIYAVALTTVLVSYYLIYQVMHNHIKYRASQLTSVSLSGHEDNILPTDNRRFRLGRDSLQRKWASFVASNPSFSLKRKVRARFNNSLDMRMESKTAKTISAVVATYFFTWTPYFIVNFWHSSGSGTRIPQMLDFFSCWLTFLNCILNPVLYAFLNRQFRHCCKEYWHRWVGLSAKQSTKQVGKPNLNVHNFSTNKAESRTTFELMSSTTSVPPGNVTRELRPTASPPRGGHSTLQVESIDETRCRTFSQESSSPHTVEPTL